MNIAKTLKYSRVKSFFFVISDIKKWWCRFYFMWKELYFWTPWGKITILSGLRVRLLVALSLAVKPATHHCLQLFLPEFKTGPNLAKHNTNAHAPPSHTQHCKWIILKLLYEIYVCDLNYLRHTSNAISIAQFSLRLLVLLLKLLPCLHISKLTQGVCNKIYKSKTKIVEGYMFDSKSPENHLKLQTQNRYQAFSRTFKKICKLSREISPLDGPIRYDYIIVPVSYLLIFLISSLYWNRSTASNPHGFCGIICTRMNSVYPFYVGIVATTLIWFAKQRTLD